MGERRLLLGGAVGLLFAVVILVLLSGFHCTAGTHTCTFSGMQQATPQERSALSHRLHLPVSSYTIDPLTNASTATLTDGGNTVTLEDIPAGAEPYVHFSHNDPAVRSEVINGVRAHRQAATISLRANGPIQSIGQCENFDEELEKCDGVWKATTIPFTQKGDVISFHVDGFSAYAGLSKQGPSYVGAQSASPVVTLISPTDGLNTTDGNTTFESNVTDDYYVENATLYTNKTGTWSPHETRWNGEIPYNDSGLLVLLHLNNESFVGENSTHVYDWSGNGNNGTVDGNTALNASGEFGNAYTFYGGGADHIAMPDGMLDSLSKGTVSFWFHPGGTSHSYQDIFGTHGSSGGAIELAYMPGSGQTIWENGGTGGCTGTPISQSWSISNPNKWHMYTFAVNGSGTKIYLDGSLVYSNASLTCFYSNFSQSATTYYSLGCGATTTPTCYSPEVYEGSLDEFSIWNRRLNSSQIAALYNYTKTSLSPAFQNVSLTPGNYSWNVRAEDNDTNIAWAANRTLKIRAPPTYTPGVTLLSPAGRNFTLDRTLTFTANAQSNSTLRYAQLYVWNSTGGTAVNGNIWAGSDSAGGLGKTYPDGTEVNYTAVAAADGDGVAFDGTYIWSTQEENGDVSRTALNGSTTMYPTILYADHHMLAVGSGTVWATNPTHDAVTKIYPNGSTVNYTVPGQPGDIASDGTDMWVTFPANDSVAKITPSGTVTMYNGTGSEPFAIAFDGTNMWVACYGDQIITKVAPNGTMTNYSGSGYKNTNGDLPGAMAFDGTNMWTANGLGHSVTRIAPNGSMTNYSLGTRRAQGIAFDGANMWVADDGSSTVTRILPNGSYTDFPTTLHPETVTFDGAPLAPLYHYNLLSGNTENTSFNYTFTKGGTYTWNVKMCDQNGICEWGTNRTIAVDPLKTIAFVQEAGNTLYASSNLSSQTFTSDVTPGDTIIAIVSWDPSGGGSQSLNITDDQGDTFQQASASPQVNQSAFSQTATLFYALNATGGPTNVTATFGAQRYFRSLTILEYANVSTTNAEDDSVSTAKTTGVVNPGTLNPTQEGDVVVAMGVAGNNTFTHREGFTLRRHDSTDELDVIDSIHNTSSPIQSYWTTPNSSYAAIAGAFKAQSFTSIATQTCAPEWFQSLRVTGVLTCENTTISATSLDITSGGRLILRNATLITGQSTIDGSLTVHNSKNSVWQNSNLTINGNYTLDNSTLHLNVSTSGAFGITVNTSGHLILANNSNITNGGGSASSYIVVNGTLTATDSVLEHLGTNSIAGITGNGTYSFERANISGSMDANGKLNFLDSTLNTTLNTAMKLESGSDGSVINNSNVQGAITVLSLLTSNTNITNSRFYGLVGWNTGSNPNIKFDHNNLTVTGNGGMRSYSGSGRTMTNVRIDVIAGNTGVRTGFQTDDLENFTIVGEGNGVGPGTMTGANWTNFVVNMTGTNDPVNFGGCTGCTLKNWTVIGNASGHALITGTGVTDTRLDDLKLEMHAANMVGLNVTDTENVTIENGSITSNSTGATGINFVEQSTNHSSYTLVNTTFLSLDQSGCSAATNCTATVEWFARANVTDNQGADVYGASVNITNVTGSLVSSTTTDMSGLSPYEAVIAYTLHNGVESTQNNHTVSASKSGYSGSTSVNVTGTTTANLTITQPETVCVNETGVCWTTIQGAIDNATSGQTVVITDNRTYNENLSTSVPLTITSNGTEMPMISDQDATAIQGNNLTIDRVRINVTGSAANIYGIQGSNNTVRNTVLYVNTSGSGVAAISGPSGLIDINHTNITLAGTVNGVVVGSYGKNGSLRIDHTRITGSTVYFLGLYFQDDVDLRNTFINGTGRGVRRSTNGNTLMRNMTILTNGNAISAGSNSGPLTVWNSLLNASGGNDAAWVSNSTNIYNSILDGGLSIKTYGKNAGQGIRVVNSTLYSGVIIEPGSDGTIFNFTIVNSSTASIGIMNHNWTVGSAVTMQKYLQVHINDTAGISLSGASISVADIYGNTRGTYSTGPTGWIAEQNITYKTYTSNGTAINNVTYDNHTITASKPGYFSNSTSVNMSSNQDVNLTLYPQSCGTLTSSLTLGRNLSVNGSTCLTITQPGITLDCNGYGIIGNQASGTYGILVQGVTGVTLKDCNVSYFDYGIYLNNTNSSLIQNVSEYNSNHDGLELNDANNNTVIGGHFVENSAATGSNRIYLTGNSRNNVIANVTPYAHTNGNLLRVDSGSSANAFENATLNSGYAGLQFNEPNISFDNASTYKSGPIYWYSKGNFKTANRCPASFGNKTAGILYMSGCNGAQIQNVTFNASCDIYGLWIDSMANATITNINVSDSCFGLARNIQLNSAQNTTMANVADSGGSLYIGSGTSSSYFKNLSLNSISLTSSNNVFNNITLSGNGANQNVYISSGYSASAVFANSTFSQQYAPLQLGRSYDNITLTNVSLNKSKFGSYSNTGITYAGWYLTTFVEDTHGFPIPGFTVTAKNSSGGVVGTGVTGSNGRAMIPLTQYTWNDSNITYAGNYSISVSKTNFTTETQSVNMTNNTQLNFTYTGHVCVNETGVCFGTVQPAIDNATAGQTVVITDNGTYAETVNISKNLTLASNGTGLPTILGDDVSAVNFEGPATAILVRRLNISLEGSAANIHAIDVNTNQALNLTDVDIWLNVTRSGAYAIRHGGTPANSYFDHLNITAVNATWMFGGWDSGTGGIFINNSRFVGHSGIAVSAYVIGGMYNTYANVTSYGFGTHLAPHANITNVTIYSLSGSLALGDYDTVIDAYLSASSGSALALGNWTYARNLTLVAPGHHAIYSVTGYMPVVADTNVVSGDLYINSYQTNHTPQNITLVNTSITPSLVVADFCDANEICAGYLQNYLHVHVNTSEPVTKHIGIDNQSSTIFSLKNSSTVSISTRDANDVIVVLAAAENASALGSTTPNVSSISDTANLTWLRRSNVTVSNVDGEVWYAIAPNVLNNDSINVTFNISGTVDDASLLVIAVANASTTSPWDSDTSLPAINTSTTVSIPNVSGVSTSNANDMLLGFHFSGGASGSAVSHQYAGSGFTLINDSTNYNGYNSVAASAENKTVNTTQSNISVSFGNTSASGTRWIMVADALRQAPAASSISGAAVTVTDNAGTVTQTNTTDSNGDIQRQNVTYYYGGQVLGTTVRDYYDNHTITASKAGYFSNSTRVNMSSNQYVNLTLRPQACGPMTTSLTLDANLSANGSTCLTITQPGVTLDCNGYSIIGNETANTYGVLAQNVSGVTVKNCQFHNWGEAIYANYTNDSYFTNDSVGENIGSFPTYYENGVYFYASHGNVLSGGNFTYSGSQSYYSRIILTGNSTNNTVANTTLYTTSGRRTVNIGSNSEQNRFENVSLEGNDEYNIGNTNNSFDNASTHDGAPILYYSKGNFEPANQCPATLHDTYAGLLFMDGCDNVQVNNITINGTAEYVGVELRNLNNGTFTNINETGMAYLTASGFYLSSGVTNSTFKNITMNKGAFSFDYSDNNLVQGLTSSVLGYTAAQGNIVTNGTFSSTNWIVYATSTPTENIVANSTFNPAAQPLYVNSNYGNYTFTNVSLNKSQFGTYTRTGITYVGWYMIAQVNDTHGYPIPGFTVTAKNSTGGTVGVGKTNAAGQAWIPLTQYSWNNSVISYQGNYSVSVSKSAFSTQTQSVNMTSNKQLNFTFQGHVCVNETGVCFGSIQAAINNATAGQTVVITDNGTYNENITIPASLTLTSNGTGWPTIDVTGATAIQLGTGSYVNISKLNVNDSGSASAISAIRSQRFGRVHLTDLNIYVNLTGSGATGGIVESSNTGSFSTSIISKVNISGAAAAGFDTENTGGGSHRGNISDVRVDGDFTYGIYSAYNNNLTLNRVSVNITGSGNGLFKASSRINNSNITVTSGHGIYLDFGVVNNTRVTTTTGTAIQAPQSNDNITVLNSIINSSSVGILLGAYWNGATYVQYLAVNNTQFFANPAIQFWEDGHGNISQYATITNSTQNGSGLQTEDIAIAGLGSSVPYVHASLQNPLDATVDNGSSSPIGGATVSATNLLGSHVFSKSTSVSGTISTQDVPYLLVVYNSSRTNTTLTNHTITASKPGYFSNSTSVNMSANRNVVLTLSQQSCGQMTTDLTLNNSLSIDGATCLTITQPGVTLDCNGYNITGNDTGGTSGVLVQGVNDVTIKNCNVTGFYNSVYLNNSNQSTVQNVTTNSYSYYGVFFNASHENTIRNSSLAGGASQPSARVYLAGNSTNNTFANDSMSATDGMKWAWINSGSKWNSFENDTFTGSSGYFNINEQNNSFDNKSTVNGGYLYYFTDGNFNPANVCPPAFMNMNAGFVYMYGCSNVLIRNITLNSSPTYRGLWILNEQNVNISRITVTDPYSFDSPVFSVTGTGGNFTDSDGGVGYLSVSASHMRFDGLNVSEIAAGEVDNDRFNQFRISGGTNAIIALYSNFTLTNSTIAQNMKTVVPSYGGYGEINLTNVSLNQSQFGSYNKPGITNVGWYLIAQVNDTHGYPISGFTVTAKNSTGGTVGTATTGTNGQAWIPLTQYTWNNSNIAYKGNYTIYATKSGFDNGSATVNMTNNTQLNFTFKGHVCVNETGYCFGTIQNAINNATAGQTVVITDNGTYTESFTIAKDLTLTSNGTGVPTISSHDATLAHLGAYGGSYITLRRLNLSIDGSASGLRVISFDNTPVVNLTDVSIWVNDSANDASALYINGAMGGGSYFNNLNVTYASGGNMWSGYGTAGTIYINHSRWIGPVGHVWGAVQIASMENTFMNVTTGSAWGFANGFKTGANLTNLTLYGKNDVIQLGDYNTLTDSYINATSGHGLYPKNHDYIQNVTADGTSYGIDAYQGANQTVIADSRIYNGLLIDSYGSNQPPTNITFVNTTLPPSQIRTNLCGANEICAAYLQNYLQVQVSESGGSGIQGATVSVTDNASRTVATATTNASGDIQKQNITYYYGGLVLGTTENNYYDNHTITVSKPGYYSNSTTVNMSSNQNLVITLSVNRPPVVKQLSVTPNPAANGTTVTVSANITDSDGIDTASAELYYPNGTLWQNLTLSNTSDIWSNTFNSLNTTYGSYTVTIWANDTYNAVNGSEGTTFLTYVNLSNPAIIIVDGSTTDWQNLSFVTDATLVGNGYDIKNVSIAHSASSIYAVVNTAATLAGQYYILLGTNGTGASTTPTGETAPFPISYYVQANSTGCSVRDQSGTSVGGCTRSISGDTLEVGFARSLVGASLNTTINVSVESANSSSQDYAPDLPSYIAYTLEYPVLDDATLNATGTNFTTSSNLTAYGVNVSGATTTIFDWRNRGSSLASLYFPFDTNVTSNSSGAIKDYSNHGNNGWLGGGTAGDVPQWTSSGASGGAYVFNGINDYITTTAQTSGPNVFSLSLWFKTSHAGGKLIGFENTQTGLGTSYDRHIYMGDTGVLYFGVYPGSAQLVNTTATYADGNWHYVVAQMNGSGMFLYVDGVLKASRSDITSGQSYSGYWKIGGGALNGWTYKPSDLFFNGTIDDVSVYARDLSAQQVAAQYNSGAPRHNLTVSQELTPNDRWTVAVTPNNGVRDGPTAYTNMLQESGQTVCINETGYCFTTIQAAVDNATAGQTVVITDSATYDENVTVGKDLTITSNGTGYPLVYFANGTAIDAGTNNVTLKRLHIRVNGTASGIEAVKMDYGTIRNVKFDGNMGANSYGIYCGAHDGLISLTDVNFTPSNVTSAMGKYCSWILNRVTVNGTVTADAIEKSQAYDASVRIKNSYLNATQYAVYGKPTNSSISNSTLYASQYNAAVLGVNASITESTIESFASTALYVGNSSSITFSTITGGGGHASINTNGESHWGITVSDSNLTYVEYNDFTYAYNQNFTFINTTLSSSGTPTVLMTCTGGECYAYFANHYSLHVNDTSGNDISGATVTIHDSTGRLIGRWTTDANGNIPNQNLTDALKKNLYGTASTVSYSPYDVYVYKSGYASSETSVDMSSNQQDTVTLTHQLSCTMVASTSCTNGTKYLGVMNTSGGYDNAHAQLYPDGWWNTSWAYREEITFDNSASSTNLTDFPVMVVLNSSDINYAHVATGGTDLRFVDGDGYTSIPYQIEKWNASGNSYVWVKVPQIDAGSTTDHIWMYYGNSTVSDAQNASAVWSDSYVGVWHLSSNSSANDSTSYGNNGAVIGSPTNTTGEMDGALHFDGSGQYIDIPNASSLNFVNASNYTIGAWVYPEWTETANPDAIVQQLDGTGSGRTHLFIDLSNTYCTTGATKQYMTYVGNTATCSNVSAVNNSWAYVAETVVENGTNDVVRFYVNGTLEKTTNVNSESNLNGSWRIGRHRTYTTWDFEGKIDEVRMSDVRRSGDYIKAEYLAGTGQFATVGSEQVPSDGITYNNSLCCSTDQNGTLGTSCSSGDQFLSLYSTDNSHVQETSVGTYTVPVCMSFSAGTVSCSYQTGSCSQNSNCVLSMASADNSHIGACGEYNINVCCTLPPTLTSLLLNATSTRNWTTDDFNLWPQGAQGYRTIIYDWYLNGTPFAMLDLSFDTNVSVATTGAIKDYSGNGHNATLGGGTVARMPTWNASGASGGAYHFTNGTYIDVGAVGNYSRTIVFWLHPDTAITATSPTRQLIELGKHVADDLGVLMGSSTSALSNEIIEVRSSAGKSGWCSSSGSISAAWHQFVAVWNGTRYEIYVDGVRKDNCYQGTSSIINATDVWVGNWQSALSSASSGFNGSIDDVQLFNRSLSASQIQSMYHSGTPYMQTMKSTELSVNDTWYATGTPNNGFTDGPTVTSNSITIVNNAPNTPTLMEPGNNTTVTTATPYFNWTNSTDPNGDAVHYEINITAPSGCAALPVRNVTPSEYTSVDTLCTDKSYYWSVRACDNLQYCSPWTPEWNFTVTSVVSIDFVTNNTDFGQMAPSTASVNNTNSTLDNSPLPLEVNNTGTVAVNLTIKALGALWTNEGLNTTYFEYADENSSDWQNVTLNYTNLTTNLSVAHTRQIEINITVPVNEPNGAKQSTLEVLAGAAQ